MNFDIKYIRIGINQIIIKYGSILEQSTVIIKII